MTRRIAICLLAFFWATPLVGAEVSRPSLILTAEAVRDIKAARTSYPFFETAFDEAVGRVERSLREGVVVPMPKDPGGGYTHERHKENSKVIHDAGLLYQLTGKQAYLDHARTLLLAYADMYPDLPLHPARKAQSPGKLFWQILNESVWLVYAVQGYDAIAEGLGDADRTRIENDLLRPMADFLSLGSPETFRKIHNHATWAAAAVGMTGYALRDQSLVDRALQGLDGDGSSGFLAQLERLFSPDGYYTEGPYYQRYALMPFILFAQSIEHNDPQQKIFAYRDGILLKAIDATIQQSYAGKFFPINDAIKEKGLDTPELVYAVATAYGLTHRKDLLSIAKYQGKTILSGDGLAVARAMANGVEGDFAFRSLLLRDGPHGDRGALAIMRMGAGALAQTVIAKNTSHGFGHGHFDKLAIAVFDHGREILADYGAARFLNVPTKDGGRYLPENESWAKQTVAHNTLVVDEASQFAGDWHQSQKHWPRVTYFQAGEKLNAVSAVLDEAYPDTTIMRTVVQFSHPAFSSPIVVDVVHAKAAKTAQFDLPFYVQGQLVDFDGKLAKTATCLKPLGDNNGYQHLWVEAVGAPSRDQIRISWLNGARFYTVHSLAPKRTDAVFVRLGANDPNFNLRPEQGVILRAPKAKTVAFINVIEPHGIYDTAAEFTVGSEAQIADVEHALVNGADLVLIKTRGGEEIAIAIANDPAPEKHHRIAHGNREWRWDGFIKMWGN